MPVKRAKCWSSKELCLIYQHSTTKWTCKLFCCLASSFCPNNLILRGIFITSPLFLSRVYEEATLGPEGTGVTELGFCLVLSVESQAPSVYIGESVSPFGNISEVARESPWPTVAMTDCLVPQLLHHQSKHQPEIDVQLSMNVSRICSPETGHIE